MKCWRFQCDGEMVWNEYHQQWKCSKCHKTIKTIGDDESKDKALWIHEGNPG